MILGMTTETFTLLHVLLSVVGILAGLIVLGGLIGGKRLGVWNGLFLSTTVATSATGYAFPTAGLTPAQVIGALSLAALALAILADYRFRLAGGWRRVYVVGASVALYFNVFVLVVQAFQKVPMLKDAAPTQSEAPFAAAQTAVLALFVGLTVSAVRNFRDASRLS